MLNILSVYEFNKSQPGELQAYNAKGRSLQRDSREMSENFQRKKKQLIHSQGLSMLLPGKGQLAVAKWSRSVQPEA